MLRFISYTEGLHHLNVFVLSRRVPHYCHADLTRWYQGPNLKKRLRVLQYYVNRCRINLEILEAQELVARVW